MSERDNKPHDPNVTADVPSAAADSAGAADALRTTDHATSRRKKARLSLSTFCGFGLLGNRPMTRRKQVR
jgi:hypothetical protein